MIWVWKWQAATCSNFSHWTRILARTKCDTGIWNPLGYLQLRNPSKPLNLPLDSGFLIEIMYVSLISLTRVSYPSFLNQLDLIALIIFGNAYKFWNWLLCSFFPPRPNFTVAPFFAAPSTLFSTLSSVCFRSSNFGHQSLIDELE